MRLFPTALRRDKYYYRIYCVGLNTVFASVLPLLSLLYLNMRTVAQLRKMAETMSSCVSPPPSTAATSFAGNGVVAGGGLSRGSKAVVVQRAGRDSAEALIGLRSNTGNNQGPQKRHSQRSVSAKNGVYGRRQQSMELLEQGPSSKPALDSAKRLVR